MFRSEGTPKWRVALAGVTGAALLSLGAGSAAMAQDETPIITQDEGSLTIHKYATDAIDGTVNDGLPKDGLDPDLAIADVEFTIYPVQGIDLSSNQGWLDAAALVGDIGSNPAIGDFTDPNTLGAALEQTTDPDGVAVFPSLPIGLYYVTETSTPAGVVQGAPFLITVPITHPVNTNDWIYDVNVYPKNSIVGGEKSVEDAEDVQLGDEVTYTIAGDIPDNAVTDAYRVIDRMHEALELIEESIAVTIGGTDAVEGTHYDVTIPASGTPATGFQIDLTEEGRALAFAEKTADPAAQVVVTFDAEVIASGEIVNTAEIYPNQPSIDNDTPVTPEVETKWGGITLHKVDAGTEEGIEGAVFEVHYSNTDDFATATPVLADNGTDARTWTTLEDGTIAIDGLRYSNFADGESVAPGHDDYRYYFLVEVQAAPGYELLAQPIQFLVTDQAANIDLEVENVPHNAGFELPLTGGTGTIMFTVLGLMLLAGAATWVVARRRKADAQV